MTGTRLTVTGYVYDTACQPIPGALLDFWHCDDAGVYDNAATGCAGISLPRTTAGSRWRRSCPRPIPAAPATSTSKRRRQTSRC